MTQNQWSRDQQPYINFVRSTSTLTSVQQANETENSVEATTQTTGESVSRFYQSVVLTESSSTSRAPFPPPPPPKSVIVHTSTLPPSTNQPPLKANDIFRFAQNGKLKECQRWLSEAKTSDFNVNERDSYHWTPLMVAACSGHLEIVKLLLDNGADASARCNRGMSALDLAKKSRHSRVVALLSDYHRPRAKSPPKLTDTVTTLSENSKVISTFECDSCGVVRGIEPIKHETSIEHQLKSGQFSSEQTRSLGYYAHVNRHSVGYQLLLKEGWSGTSGLGAKEEGRRYPIRAHKKPDRAGIGLPQTSEPKALQEGNQRVEKYKMKHKLISDHKRKQRLEANFRRSFRDDPM